MVPVSEQDEQILNMKIKQYSTWFVETVTSLQR